MNAVVQAMTPGVRLATISSEPDFLAQLCERIAEGDSLRSLARAWEVPAAGLRSWLMGAPERIEQFERAMELRRQMVDEDWSAAVQGMIRADVREVFDAEGRPLPVGEIPDEVAMSLAGIEVEDRTEGTGEDAREVTVRRYRLTDRTKALEMWGRHRKMFTDKTEIGMSESVAETLERLKRGRPVE